MILFPNFACLACFVLAGCTEPAPSARSPTRTVTLPAPAGSARAPGGPAHAVADPPEPGPEFWMQELEWARKRFPALQDLTLDVDFRPLLEWVPAGKTVTLFLRAEHTLSSGKEIRYECSTVEATRFESADGDASLALLIPGPERVEKGERIRDYLSGVADVDSVALGYRGKQRRRQDGTWQEFDGYSAGYIWLGAFVGPVDADTAHFRYVKVEPRATCGPVVRIPCDDGERRGHNVCNVCETVELELDAPMWSRGSRPPLDRQCDVPCPIVENPELDRIQRLLENLPTGFAPYPKHLGVALYRTLAACKADPLWPLTPPTR